MSPGQWRTSGPRVHPQRPGGCVCFYEVGDEPMAKEIYQQAVQLRGASGQAGEGWELFLTGPGGRKEEELGPAQEYQEQALSLAAETGDAELQARTKIALAAVHCHLDSPEAIDKTVRYAQEAVDSARAHRVPSGGEHRAVTPGHGSSSPAQCRRGPQMLHRGGPTGREKEARLRVNRT